MKTAMQQHLEWLKARMVVTEQMEQELLDQEMSQLLDAYKQGIEDWNVGDLSGNTKNKSAARYYNETFKQD